MVNRFEYQEYMQQGEMYTIDMLENDIRDDWIARHGGQQYDWLQFVMDMDHSLGYFHCGNVRVCFSDFV